MRSKPARPEAIEEYREERWRREGTRQVATALEAERFIEQVGFAACLTDSRKPGPLFYVSVCGRRDAVMPRNVQKDEEAWLTWLLKTTSMRRFSRNLRHRSALLWKVADHPAPPLPSAVRIDRSVSKR